MAENFPNLRTERLWLKQFADSDIEKVFEGLSDPDVIKYYGVNYKSLAETKLQIEWFKNLEAEGTGIWWAVHSSDGKEFYGAIGFNNLSIIHQKAEIGFWLLPAYWGKGIMQEALQLVCIYGFEHVKLHRIEAMVESENKQCQSLLNKLDFKYEGTMRDCEIKNEDFISLDIYAKFNNPH
ncbi:MAG: GNAT family N-acetyltransferase [Bacteroidota bacterium]